MKELPSHCWLSVSGEYHELINRLVSSDPRLRHRDPKAESQGMSWPNKNVKLVGLQLRSDGKFQGPFEYTPQSLREHLQTSKSATCSTVYILEGLHPDFISVLGEHLGLHPSIFVDHERVVINSEKECDNVGLPSLLKSREHCTMKYFQLFSLPKNVHGCFKMYCEATGRHIGVTRVAGAFSNVGILRRKCSFWTRQTEAGHPWKCLIITDPPLQAVRLARMGADGVQVTDETVPISPSHFQGGYLDFVPHEYQMITKAGPPRTSMLDDLCFYIKLYTSFIGVDKPEGVVLFAKKIVASHYLQHAEFLRSIISTTQFHMSRKATIRLRHFSDDYVETQWSDSQALVRRMCEYCEGLEAIMLQCGIASYQPNLNDMKSWHDVATDFQFLHRTFRDLRRRTERLNSATVGLASIASNQQALREHASSLKEAKNMKSLTLLGLIFIPLAYTSSLFSMTQPYGPGGDQFWIYFAISGPLVLFVLGLFYVATVEFKVFKWNSLLSEDNINKYTTRKRQESRGARGTKDSSRV